MTGTQEVARDIYVLEADIEGGDILENGLDTGASRTTAGFATCTFEGEGTNQEYVGDKVQAGATGGTVIFTISASRFSGAGNLIVRAWSAPTEGTSAGATKIAEITGPAPNISPATESHTLLGALGVDEFLILEWVSATGAPVGSLNSPALISYG